MFSIQIFAREAKLIEQMNGLVQEGRKWLFQVKFFSFKSAWIFACAFQLSRKTFSCIVFWLKWSCSALLCSLCTLQYFVFVFLRNKVQTRQKKYGGMMYYLIEKHMKKFRYFWRKKNFTWKSHLRPSCTKPFKYASFKNIKFPKGNYRADSSKTKTPYLNNRVFLSRNYGLIVAR